MAPVLVCPEGGPRQPTRRSARTPDRRPQTPEAPESPATPAPERNPDPDAAEPVLNIPLDPPAPGGDDVARHVFPLAPAMLQPIGDGQCQPPEPGSMRWYSSHDWQKFEHAFVCRRCFRC